MRLAEYCASTFVEQQTPIRVHMQLVEMAVDTNSVAEMSADANRYVTILQQEMDGMPSRVTPMLQDELAVLMQVASGETPDLDRYRTATDGITTLCNKYR